MRIHTDVLTYAHFRAAARLARVDMEITEHGSKSRARAFNVKLEGESRRRPNGGSSGAGSGYAATWDQWGVFLADLFQNDNAMVTPYYSDSNDFATKTGDRFGAPTVEMGDHGYENVFIAFEWPADAHGDHRFQWQGVPFERSCTKCTAVQRWAV